ncbi:hypothetical protein Clacol_002239 [Clathrus columnatus]|uniref:MFS general substrate transporter n=1 Tax=Clathrus columnatus TaxID=1419009 RepID=A0AAV5A336_9AGAM|nr:hypothetical protein Clacol_002239 [Clathrus columnatus]
MSGKENVGYKEQNSIDEKRSVSEISYDIENGDEALKLVGTLRSVYFSEEYNARLRRKLDLLIPPICAAVYSTQYLDKTSLNYASIMGLPILGQHYNLVTLAFYVGHSNLLVLRHGTSVFSRPCSIALPNSIHFPQNGMAQVFGGFVAYGISFSDSTTLPPYKIMYVILGGLAIVLGICILIWLPDSPVHARFLTKEERIAALERVRDDQGGTENKQFKKEQVWEALTDIRTWLIVVSTLTMSIPSGGLGSFSNIIIRNFGYTSRQTLILATPGGVAGSVTTLLCGYYSDKKNERMMPIVFAVVPTIIGFAVLVGLNGSHLKGIKHVINDQNSGLTKTSQGVLLFASYLIQTFGSSLSIIYAWNASNTSGHTKKVTINAITLVAFALGNVAGSETFLPKDAPGYLPGKIALLVLLSAQIVISLLMRWINMNLNRKKRRTLEEEKARRGWTDEDVEKERQKHAFLDMTDKQNMFFVYTA